MYTFHIADYVVGVLVLLVPVVIGATFAVRDQNRATREEYLMGGRQMSMFPVAISIFITFQSAISQIGIPSEVYSYGSMYTILGCGFALSYIVGIYTYLPLLYPLRLISIYEYLHLRYRSSGVRLMTTCMGMLQTIGYMAVALLSPALALQASAGIPLWVSVILVGVIGTLYTTIGGIKSVIWTDLFQTIIVFVGIFAIIIKGCMEVGSAEQIWEIAHSSYRTKMDTIDFDPRVRHTYWSCLIGGCFLWFVNGYNQSTIQRVCAMKSLKAAKTSFLVNIPFVIFYNFILVVVGNIVFAYIAFSRCDPYEAGYIGNTNQIAPYFVLNAMNDLPGMTGLYISTLCCGSLSTLSSGINALAANTVEDILRHPLRNVREGTATFITKVATLVHGVVIVGFAWGAKDLDGPVTQMSSSVMGAFGSPIFGIFIIGCCIPWANKYGAFAGAMTALAFNLWVAIGHRLYGTPAFEPVTTEMCSLNETNISSSFDALSSIMITTDAAVNMSTGSTANTREFGFFLFDVSYEWYSLMGTIVSVVVGLLVSFLTKSLRGSNGVVDARLILPILRKFWNMDVDDVKYELSQHKEMELSVKTTTVLKSPE